MTLVWLILIPIAGGVAAWAAGRKNPAMPRWVALFALALDLLLLARLWGLEASPGEWIAETRAHWVPELGIGLHLAIDGLGLVFVTLTALLGMASVTASWTEIKKSTGSFHFNLLWAVSGIIGAFISMDLFLFYFFWELMLIPMYFIIALWGHENRRYASIKFFIFTQAGGLLMLLSILGLYFAHGRATGAYSFDLSVLAGTALPPVTELLLMLGFLAAFAVKLPVVPFHTWLPDAHTEAPAAGSVLLAGLLLKTGAYGLIRFVLPVFPFASDFIAPAALALGAAGVIYGAVLAFGQTDFKRLVAYTSVSHMGFVLIGIFAGSELALKGALVQAVCHGFSTGALFMAAGWLQERTRTRDLRLMGGLWATAPVFGSITLFFALASLGLPGLGNFVGEFLVLAGTFGEHPATAAFAASGIVLSAVYALWMVQAVFQGPVESISGIPDLNSREGAAMAALAAAILWLGLYPQPLLDRLGFINRTYTQSAERPAFSQRGDLLPKQAVPYKGVKDERP